jgi:hypothetical protein
MAWAAGTFSRIFGATGWTDDKNNAVKILASRHDTHDQDLADGINSCLTRDNQAKPTSSFLPATDNTINLGSGSFRWASINGVSFSNLARLDTQNVFAAAIGTGTYPVLISNATTAGMALKSTGAGADLKLWDCYVDTSGVMHWRVVTDTALGATDFVTVTRNTALTPASINLQATAVQVNGTPINVLAAFKTASTSRNTTTTFASDPDLAFSNVPAGTYEIELALFFDSTLAACGFKAQLSLSGTVANGILAPFGANGSNSTNVLGYQSFSGGIINVMTFSSGFATATQNWIFARGTVTLSTTQNVALQWAQQTSSGSAAVLQVMSRMTLRRIA